MIGTLLLPDRLMRALRHGLATILLVLASATVAQSSSDVAVVDDVVIYYAVLPAEMLRTYPEGSDEARMHGGVPGRNHVHHIQVALFDANSNARITDARVSVTINETGFAGTELELEPFLIGEALAYGGYFEFAKRVGYEINVRATLSENDRVIEKTFEFLHH